MYLRDGAVTAIVLTGGYYYCSYTFFSIHTNILRAPLLPAMIQQVPRRSAEVSPRAPSRSCSEVPRGTRCGCPRGPGLPVNMENHVSAFLAETLAERLRHSHDEDIAVSVVFAVHLTEAA